MRNLLKRSTTFFAGQMLGKIISTIVYIWMARVLGPEQFGVSVLVYLLLNVNSFVFDLGLGPWYQKHVRDDNRNELFAKTLLLKLSVGALGGIICVLYIFSRTHSLLLIPEFLLASFIDLLIGHASAYYLEQKKVKRISISAMIRVFGIALFMIFAGTKTSFHTITQGYIAGGLFWLLLWFPRDMLSIKGISIKQEWKIFKESSHFAYLQITSFAYARADSLIIENTIGATFLGIYGAAYRYLEAAAMFPNAIAQNLFHISAKEHIPQKQLVKLAAFTSFLGLLAAGATYMLSPFLITGLMGPAYAAGIPILQILSIVVFLFFFNAPLATFIQSSSLLKKFLPFGIGNTILNIVLNVILIPLYGIQAAAWNMVLTEVLGGVINVCFVKKIYAEKRNN